MWIESSPHLAILFKMFSWKNIDDIESIIMSCLHTGILADHKIDLGPDSFVVHRCIRKMTNKQTMFCLS